MKIGILALLGALLTAIFASNFFVSMVCFRQADCSPFAKAEATMLGIFAAFAIGITGAAITFAGTPSNKAIWAGSTAFGAFMVAAFGVFADPDFPVESMLLSGYFAFVLFGLIAIPLALYPTDPSYQQVGSVYGRIGCTICGAIIIAIPTQALGEIVWTGFDGWGASKFVVAPSGTVIAGAAWCAMAMVGRDDPTLTGTFRRAIWAAFALGGAVCFAAAHGLFFMADHVTVADSRATAAIASSVLILPGVMIGYLTLKIANGRLMKRPRWLPTMVVGTILTALFAYFLGYVLQADGIQFADHIRPHVAFAFSQTIAVVGIILSLMVGDRLIRFARTYLNLG